MRKGSGTTSSSGSQPCADRFISWRKRMCKPTADETSHVLSGFLHREKTELKRAFVSGVKRWCCEHLSAPSDSGHIYRAPLHRYCPVTRFKNTAMILSSGFYNRDLCSSCDNAYLACKTLLIPWEILQQQEVIVLTCNFPDVYRGGLWISWQGTRGVCLILNSQGGAYWRAGPSTCYTPDRPDVERRTHHELQPTFKWQYITIYQKKSVEVSNMRGFKLGWLAKCSSRFSSNIQIKSK